MNYAGIVSLIQNSQQSENWEQIANATGDGGWVAFCKADVALTLEASIAWHIGKPSTRFMFRYEGTVISWFEIPIVALSSGPSSHVEELQRATNQFLARI